MRTAIALGLLALGIFLAGVNLGEWDGRGQRQVVVVPVVSVQDGRVCPCP